MQEYLEGKRGEETIRIPLDTLIPVRRNGQVVYEKISVVKEDIDRQVDYRHKTAALAEQRRAFEAKQQEWSMEKARTDAVNAAAAAERKAYEDAIADPEKWEQWQQHQEAYRTNPVYRANVDAAREKAVTDAENEVYRQGHDQQIAAVTAERVLGAIDSMATHFPGVDVDLVRQAYGDALQQERAELTTESLRSFFRAEAQRRERYAAPSADTQALTARVAELEASLAQQREAEKHNATTAHALNRDTMGRFTAPAGGTPPNPAHRPPATPYTSADKKERERAWINGR